MHTGTTAPGQDLNRRWQAPRGLQAAAVGDRQPAAVAAPAFPEELADGPTAGASSATAKEAEATGTHLQARGAIAASVPRRGVPNSSGALAEVEQAYKEALADVEAFDLAFGSSDVAAVRKFSTDARRKLERAYRLGLEPGKGKNQVNVMRQVQMAARLRLGLPVEEAETSRPTVTAVPLQRIPEEGQDASASA